MRTIVFLMGVALSVEARQPQGVPWNRTPDAFAGKTVTLTLTSGVLLEGHWASVTPTTFTMNVATSSNEFEVGKGKQTLPRTSIVKVRAGVRRARGRAWGVAGGWIGGMFVGERILGAQGQRAGIANAVVPVVITVGYFIGRSRDLATREITLLPEVP